MLGIATTLAISLLAGAQDAPPPPPRPPLLMPLYISFAALQVADGYQTWDTMRRGGAEANPVTAPFASSPYGIVALKASAGTATILVVERIRRKHPRAAVVFMIAVNAGMTAVAYHNARERAGP